MFLFISRIIDTRCTTTASIYFYCCCCVEMPLIPKSFINSLGYFVSMSFRLLRMFPNIFLLISSSAKWC